jgi:hypothetical protein
VEEEEEEEDVAYYESRTQSKDRVQENETVTIIFRDRM